MRRSWPLLISASFVTGVLLGCVDRRLDAEIDETEEMPACLIIFGYGSWDDGRRQVLQNENYDTSFICMCMTWDEQQELTFGDVELFIEHEINLRALEECERISALREFDDDPCQEYYETGEWRAGLGFAFGDGAYKNREGLTCGDEGEGDELGCTLDRGPASPTWLLMLAGMLGLRRRRLARARSTASEAELHFHELGTPTAEGTHASSPRQCSSLPSRAKPDHVVLGADRRRTSALDARAQRR